MDTSNTINAWLLGVTGLATAIAGWSAFTAHRARRDAASASFAAEGFEKAAAESARRSAAALARTSEATGRIAAVMEEARAERPPWVIEDLGGGHLKWLVRNMTGHRLFASLGFSGVTRSQKMTSETPGGQYREVGPGEALWFTWERLGPAARRDVVVEIMYWLPNEAAFTTQITLLWPEPD